MSRSLTPLLLSCILLAPATAQTYGNATYNRLSIVTQFHTREFSIDTTTVMNEYVKGIIVIPYIIGIGFFFALLFFEIALCCRWCCDWCRCINTLDETRRKSITTFTKWAKSIKNSRKRLIKLFFLFIIMCILCCGGFVICRSYFVDGSDKMLDAADVLYDMTRDLEDSGDDMFYLGESVRNNTLLAIPTCPEAEVILDYTDVYLDSVNEYNDIIDPIPGDINDVRGFADDGSQNIQQGLWSLVSVFTLICIFNVLSFSLRKRLMMRIALGIGLVLIHCTLIAWMGATVMLMILSDFCMAPTDNAISLSEASVEDMAYYYGTCNGTNPLYEPISSSVDAVTALAATVTTLTEEGGACEDNPYLLATYPSIANMFGNISFIEQASDCPPLQNEWANLYNESFCHSYFIAMYAMFWTLSCLLVCHFLLMITSSLISQYFDEYWETGDIIGGMDPTALNENLLESANQLQPDGSLTLSSAVMDSSGHNMQIRYSNYTHNVPNTTTNDALLEKKVDYDSEPQIRKSAGDAGSRGSLFEEM